MLNNAGVAGHNIAADDEVKELIAVGVSTTTDEDEQSLLLLSRWKWWFLVVINVAILLMGQSGAVLLGRFYFDQGGKSIWMATLVQSVAFPILFFPLFFFPHSENPSVSTDLTINTSTHTVIMVYILLGTLLAGDNLMYTIGLLYLPVSTYSLICASQLAFNAIFSFFINAQKLTLLVLNTVVFLTISASLLAVHSDSSENETMNVTSSKHMVGISCTIGASAGYALLLCLMQVSFERVLKRETFSVVLDMQIWTSFVASCVCIVGMFASGEWQGLRDEMRRFKAGREVYILTLAGTALAWQICSVGVVGLIYLVSSFFSNVMSMLNLPLVPVAAVLLYHEHIDGVKIVAMLLSIFGFSSYIYQNYLDDTKSKAPEGIHDTATPETSIS
ncbi:probable purine permease 11 [Vigna radiata var. radiata]|uniref:Probable purine permease n=1 Tax=Vigna radiata var. radiata TaxID=3916 RepID=A0A1S3U0E9_VIGRR|nr:probable purine permease 11 [Vigna radiata var. radiata]